MRSKTNFIITVLKRLKLHYFLSPGFSLDLRIFKDSEGKTGASFWYYFIIFVIMFTYTSLGYQPNKRGITDI